MSWSKLIIDYVMVHAYLSLTFCKSLLLVSLKSSNIPLYVFTLNFLIFVDVWLSFKYVVFDCDLKVYQRDHTWICGNSDSNVFVNTSYTVSTLFRRSDLWMCRNRPVWVINSLSYKPSSCLNIYDQKKKKTVVRVQYSSKRTN